MSTEISDLYTSLRHILGDRDSNAYRYENSALLAGVQTIMKCGKVTGYSLTSDTLGITPDLTDPNDFALTLYHTALSFIASEPDGWSFRTRSASKTVGSSKGFVRQLEANIHDLENGEMFDSWQSFGEWVRGVQGIDLASFLSPMGTITKLTTISVNE